MAAATKRPRGKTVGRLRLAGVIAIVVIPGAVTLGLLGAFVSRPGDLPGFWDYPSGTIGDGLLLPAVFAALFVQLQALRPVRKAQERGVMRVGFAAGAVGGAAVPASWIANSSTANMWLLPRAHYFSTAGWVHAFYLTITSGVLVATVALMFCRLRARRAGEQNGSSGLLVGPITIAMGAGLGMLVLIGRDAVNGGAAPASATTIAALLVIAAAFLVGLAWSAGPIRPANAVKSIIVVATFLAGLMLTIIHWHPADPLIVGIGSASALLGAIAATSNLGAIGNASYRWPLTFAIATLLTGGLVRAVDGYVHGDHAPLVWLLLTLVLSGGLLALFLRERPLVWKSTRHMFFIAYCLLLVYLAARLRSPGAEHASAGASVAVADTAFDVMVFALIQSRFGEWGERDEMSFSVEYVADEESVGAWKARLKTVTEALAPSASMQDVVLLGFAVALSLLTLFAVAAGPLGLNRATASPDPVRFIGIGAVLVALALFGGAFWLSRRWLRSASRPVVGPALDRLGLPSGYWLVPSLSALSWVGAALALSGGPKHVWALSAIVALTVFAFYARSLIYGTSVLNTLSPSRGQIALSLWVALCCATAAFLFVSVGLWQGRSSLSGAWLAISALVYFVGSVAVFLAAGLSLAVGLPDRSVRPTQTVLARQAVEAYLALDGVVLGLVLTIAVILPLYAASRDQAFHAAPLNVIAAMVFLPGLITGVIWGLQNWRKYDEATRRASATGVPITMIERTDSDRAAAKALDSTRVTRLHEHLVFLRNCEVVLLAVGLGYLAYVLLR